MSNENEKKEWELKYNVEEKRNYNLMTLDSALLNGSAVGIGILVYMYDKFCGSLFNATLGLFVVSLMCHLVSFKMAVISQNYYLLFIDKSNVRDKLKYFDICNKAYSVNVFLDYVALCSFVTACIAFVAMFWIGL
jgi:uncharacterized membrane-anchored protein